MSSPLKGAKNSPTDRARLRAGKGFVEDSPGAAVSILSVNVSKETATVDKPPRCHHVRAEELA
jgi:hypothetical protein